MKNDAPRLAKAQRAPRRSRTTSNTGRFDIVATRPDISAKTTIPMTPMPPPHANRIPNRAPVSLFATRSPMSTNPPNAVRIPRKISSIFFTRSPVPCRERVEFVRELFQRARGLGQAAIRPACRDPDLCDHVARPLDGGEQRGPKLVRLGVGRLDRC